jgi:hypothetical protein
MDGARDRHHATVVGARSRDAGRDAYSRSSMGSRHRKSMSARRSMPPSLLRRTVQVYSVFDRGLTRFEMGWSANLDQALAARQGTPSRPMPRAPRHRPGSESLSLARTPARRPPSRRQAGERFPFHPARRPSSPTSGSRAWVTGRGHAYGQHHRYSSIRITGGALGRGC